MSAGAIMISARRVQTGQSNFYGFDPMGNTRLLASSAGAVTDTYSYKAFGEELSSSGSTSNPYRFGGEVGYYRDKVERVYVRARHYAPQTARWLSRDPIGFDGGDFNLYRYVFNSPVNWADPLGFKPNNPSDPYGYEKELRRRLEEEISNIFRGMKACVTRDCSK